MSTVALILATGLSESMKSTQPPALHPILGDPALLWVLRALAAPVDSAIVLGSDGGALASAVEAWGKKKLLPCSTLAIETGSSADAFQALEHLKTESVLVLSAEIPLVNPETLKTLMTHERAVSSSGVVYLSMAELKPILLEARDLSSLADALRAVASSIKTKVETRGIEESQILATRRDQAVLQILARDIVNTEWMDRGVSFLDSASTFVGPRVALAQDVLLDPCVSIEGDTQIGVGSRIGRGSILKDCLIGEAVEIKAYTMAQEARIGSTSIVGPFSRLREGTVLEERVHIGNFVETKKTTMKTGAKANHLSYLGDTEVGEGTNIGAGLITCNYDGFRKHRTIIGRNVFVGSDCQLIAPVTIGDGALLGAGSTITENIPSNALAFTRSPLVVKEDGAQRLRDRLRAQLG